MIAFGGVLTGVMNPPMLAPNATASTSADRSRGGVDGSLARGVMIASIIAAVAVLLMKIDRNPVVQMTAMTRR